MLLTYYAVAGPAVLLIGLVYDRLLFLAEPNKSLARALLWVLPAAMTLALVILAQLRAWPRWLLILLHLLWMVVVPVCLVFLPQL